MTTIRIAPAAAALLLVAACGGGGGGGGLPAPADPLVPNSDIPTSATTSSAGAFTFVSSVQATTSDGGDLLVLGDAVLATSETDDPQPL